MTRSAFDEVVAQHYPTPSDFPPPATGMLPGLPETPEPHCTLSAEDFYAFIHRSMTLHGSLVLWKGEARKAVHHLWGKECESLLSFHVNGERQVVRQADVAWVLIHKRPIPAGHAVKHSDGNVMNRDPHNLWLVRVSD